MRHGNYALATLLLVGVSASAYGQSITNGNFPTDLSGWTTQGPDTMWVSDSGPDSVSGVAWINDVPNVDSFLQQTITGLTTGQTYTISGYYKSHTFFFGSGSFTASVDGTTDFANTDTAFVSNWTAFSFPFAAASTSAVLRFDTQVGNDSDYVVDNIAINSAAVPEPGSIALLIGMGLTGAGFLARQRVRIRKAA